MNLGQMMLVLLAIVLVTSIVITLFNNFNGQVELATRNVYFTQGVKIADMEFQRLESLLISEELTFDSMYSQLVEGSILRHVDLFGNTFEYRVFTLPSDVSGNLLFDIDGFLLDITGERIQDSNCPVFFSTPSECDKCNNFGCFMRVPDDFNIEDVRNQLVTVRIRTEINGTPVEIGTNAFPFSNPRNPV